MAKSPKKNSFVIFPTYTEIFKDGQEEIFDQLSTEGLAEKYIVFTTSLSALLYASHIKGMYVQEEIMIEFKDVLCNTSDGYAIMNWLYLNDKKTLNINNFTLMELYCILLKHKKGECIDTSMTVDEKLTYLKLIFIANEKRLNKHSDFHNNLLSITPDDKYSYEKMFWPLLLPETDVNEAIRIEYEMYRLKCFVEEIEKEYPDATCTIDAFFKERGYENYSSYASALSVVFLDYMTCYTNHHKLKAGIKESKQTHKLFAPLMVNNITINSYLELKTHPVYYYNGAYYVLHWNYFLSQIFIGTFMAIKGRLNACGLNDIKKECGTIIEKTLFKIVLKSSFGKIWQQALFDEQGKGLPDAIFRMGNHLFIIELKDSLMKESIMESTDFESIEKYLTETFIQSGKGKRKGIKQLTAYINDYRKGRYEKEGFPYNKRLNIYPVIVVTDYKYRLNGLNHFLGVKFDEMVKQDAALLPIRQRIRPLTIIGLDSLFNLQFKFQAKQIKFADSIDNYHKHVKINKKRREYKGVVKYSQLYPSYDRYLPDNSNVLMSVSEIKLLFKDFFNLQMNA